jgi:hypothetical protein
MNEKEAAVTVAIEAIRAVVGRRWNSEERCWSIPADRRSANTLIARLRDTGMFSIAESESRWRQTRPRWQRSLQS